MGFFRRTFERIREFFTREPSHVDTTPDDTGEDDSELDNEFDQQGWTGVDIQDAYYVIEAAIDDMEDRGSI